MINFTDYGHNCRQTEDAVDLQGVAYRDGQQDFGQFSPLQRLWSGFQKNIR